MTRLDEVLTRVRSPGACSEAERLAVECLLLAAAELPAAACWELATMLTTLLAERSRDPAIARRALYVAAIQTVADQLGEPPTIRVYEKWREKLAVAGVTLPASTLIVRLFRGWINALHAAGCPPHDRAGRVVDSGLHAPRVPRYEADAHLRALRACATDLGRAPTVSGYAAWRERRLRVLRRADPNASLPHHDTIRHAFGTWNGALRAAALDPQTRKMPLDLTEL